MKLYIFFIVISLLTATMPAASQSSKLETVDYAKIKDKVRNGVKAPGFSFESPSGECKSLESYKGKVIYLYVWSTSCKPCIAHYNYLKDFILRYQDRDVVFLMVNIDQNQENWESFLKSHQWYGEHVWAPGYKEPINFYVLAEFEDGSWGYPLPYQALIDKNGIIVNNMAPPPMLKDILNRQLLTLIN